MAAETPAQKKTVGRVMHEFKHGELDSAGGTVRNPKQAIAIALSEARVSNRQSPAANRRHLADSRGADPKRKERSGQMGQARREAGPTRAALYAEAARKNIRGRSGMTKAALQQALTAAS